MKSWLTRLQASLLELPPEQLPLLLSVGLVIGVFPMMFIPTILCLLAAFTLRLNAAALQILNSVTSPLQLALLIPLARVGEQLCGRMPAGGSWTSNMGFAAVHAVTGWACVCIPLGVALYAALMVALRLANPDQQAEADPQRLLVPAREVVLIGRLQIPAKSMPG